MEPVTRSNTGIATRQVSALGSAPQPPIETKLKLRRLGLRKYRNLFKTLDVIFSLLDITVQIQQIEDGG